MAAIPGYGWEEIFIAAPNLSKISGAKRFSVIKFFNQWSAQYWNVMAWTSSLKPISSLYVPIVGFHGTFYRRPPFPKRLICLHPCSMQSNFRFTSRAHFELNAATTEKKHKVHFLANSIDKCVCRKILVKFLLNFLYKILQIKAPYSKYLHFKIELPRIINAFTDK